MNNLFVYRFQTKVKMHSVNEKLANFLKEKDADLTEKERVWWAVSAFWLPLAMKESHSYTEKEIQQYGLSAIQRLQQQIAHLALVLEIEVPSSVLGAPSPVMNGESALDDEDALSESDLFDASPIESEFDSSEPEKIKFPTDISDFDDVFGYQ